MVRKFSFNEMHEIAKKAYEVMKESNEVKLIDTVLDIKKIDDVFELVTYEGVTIEVSHKSELNLLNVKNPSFDIIEYVNNIFGGLKNEVEQYQKAKKEFINKHKGITFDDVVNGYKF